MDSRIQGFLPPKKKVGVFLGPRFEGKKEGKPVPQQNKEGMASARLVATNVVGVHHGRGCDGGGDIKCPPPKSRSASGGGGGREEGRGVGVEEVVLPLLFFAHAQLDTALAGTTKAEFKRTWLLQCSVALSHHGASSSSSFFTTALDEHATLSRLVLYARLCVGCGPRALASAAVPSRWFKRNDCLCH